MKSLLTVTAVFETLTGIALVVGPSLMASLLIGVPLDRADALTLARIAGAALMSLAIACWSSRNNAPASGVVKAMLFYNIAAAAVLVYCAFGYQLSGVGMWPAVIIHIAMGVWCIICLLRMKGTAHA